MSNKNGGGNLSEIKDVELKYVLSDLKAPFKTALREISVIESIYVFVHTDDGLVGVGEAVPTPVITGDTFEGIVAAIKWMSKKLMGQTLSPSLLQVIQQSLVGNSSAKAALDMAIYDLLAKEKEVPLYLYLNSAYSSLETSHTVSLNQVETMVSDAKRYIEMGFKALKVKLGNDITLDQSRILSIHQTVPNALLSIDANQGWNEDETKVMIAFLKDKNIHIDVLEQPVFRKEYDAMHRLNKQSDIPIMADESLFDPYDAKRLSQQGIHFFNIKLMKSGGIFPGLSIAKIALENGGKCMVGSMMETHVSLTAAYHFACAIGAYKVDFDAPFMLKEKRIAGGIQYDMNQVYLENKDAYGLGIDVMKLKELYADAKSL